MAGVGRGGTGWSRIDSAAAEARVRFDDQMSSLDGGRRGRHITTDGDFGIGRCLAGDVKAHSKLNQCGWWLAAREETAQGVKQNAAYDAVPKDKVENGRRYTKGFGNVMAGFFDVGGLASVSEFTVVSKLVGSSKNTRADFSEGQTGEMELNLIGPWAGLGSAERGIVSKCITLEENRGELAKGPPK
ncbi:uncharacterized protein LY79DRAFT_678574 [Colletotrichum navitas]|uniref:Uncharacterized protein n=1 Tax=Colletotrichum navitas TaxID=681940 RepID=A0AAD8PLI5_9PEZI|nr:uncharacterized protein LY79DRAFT_678574 [Colletotrichum navitas]KAK1570011.1 hypothetical protein LY79DRAFT_678574 [Colletotrichum navitas]